MKGNMKFIAGATVLLVGAVSCGTQRAASDVSGRQDDSFSFRFYNTVADFAGQEDNILVSPYSAGVALDMLREGATAQTRDEIEAVTGKSGMTRELAEDGQTIHTSANSVWVSDRYRIRKEYAAVLDGKYDATVTSLDFLDKESPAVINGWCSEHTGGKIREVVKTLSPNDVVLLVNALHFKGAWENPFAGTYEGVFNGASGREEVTYMHRDKYARYAEADGMRMVEITFEGGAYAMYVMLPAESDKSGRISETQYRTLFSQLKPEKVKLDMPEFRMESGASLAGVLKKMGISRAFTPAAQLDGVGNGPLVVSDVAQKTFIDVNKDGCEAAAVTSVTIGLTSVMPQNSRSLKIDRPFMYVIADVESENILFAGRMMNIEKQ